MRGAKEDSDGMLTIGHRGLAAIPVLQEAGIVLVFSPIRRTLSVQVHRRPGRIAERDQRAGDGAAVVAAQADGRDAGVAAQLAEG